MAWLLYFKSETIEYLTPRSGLVPLYPQVKDAAYVKILRKRL